MFILLLILGGLSLVALIAGFVWQLTRGSVRRESRPEMGAEVGAGETARRGAQSSKVPELSATLSKGTGTQVQGEAGTSFSAVKAALRAGRWREALPGLLLAGGLSGLLLFGSLALVTTLENKLLGLAAVAIAVFITATEVRDYLRA